MTEPDCITIPFAPLNPKNRPTMPRCRIVLATGASVEGEHHEVLEAAQKEINRLAPLIAPEPVLRSLDYVIADFSDNLHPRDFIEHGCDSCSADTLEACSDSCGGATLDHHLTKIIAWRKATA